MHCSLCRDKKVIEEMFQAACPKFITPSIPDYDAAPDNIGKVCRCFVCLVTITVSLLNLFHVQYVRMHGH